MPDIPGVRSPRSMSGDQWENLFRVFAEEGIGIMRLGERFGISSKTVRRRLQNHFGPDYMKLRQEDRC